MGAREMATHQMSEVIRHLRTVLIRDGAGLTDADLLRRFLSQRDDAALAALVRRHGPMVWGVCRRLLRSSRDAEDAFQATFFVLVRKAVALPDKESVANWLYEVAYQTAVRARATAAKHDVHEGQVAEMPETTEGKHLLQLLDDELSRLPAKYRILILLCDLQGKPRKEAAQQLGCPEGTLAGRLARARVKLAKRLNRHGLIVSGGALAAVLSQGATSTSAPATVVASTIKAANLLATGQAVPANLISAPVLALMEGVVKARFAAKIKSLAAVMLLVVLALGGAVIGARMMLGNLLF